MTTASTAETPTSTWWVTLPVEGSFEDGADVGEFGGGDGEGIERVDEPSAETLKDAEPVGLVREMPVGSRSNEPVPSALGTVVTGPLKLASSGLTDCVSFASTQKCPS